MQPLAAFSAEKVPRENICMPHTHPIHFCNADQSYFFMDKEQQGGRRHRITNRTSCCSSVWRGLLCPLIPVWPSELWWYVCLPIHSFTHSFIHSFTHSFICSLYSSFLSCLPTPSPVFFNNRACHLKKENTVNNAASLPLPTRENSSHLETSRTAWQGIYLRFFKFYALRHPTYVTCLIIFILGEGRWTV